MVSPFGAATARGLSSRAAGLRTPATGDTRRPFLGLLSFPSTRSRQILKAAKFELFKDKGGDFRFHLKAANGVIIASGQGYKSKAAAEKGIESIKTNAPASAVIDNTA
jgi:uncharacterized protein YegP (UPF0339 family)